MRFLFYFYIMKLQLLILFFIPLSLFSQTKEIAIKSAHDSLYYMNHEAAIQILENYLLVDSMDADIYYELGMAKCASKSFGYVEEFSKALVIDSTHYESLMQVGGYYFFHNQPELALLEYKKAYRLTNND